MNPPILYCKYCGKQLQYKNIQSIRNFKLNIYQVREYTCIHCKALFLFELSNTCETLDLAIEKLQTYMNEQLFEISIYYKENFSCIDSGYTPLMNDFMTYHSGLEKLHEVHIRLDCVIQITPDNINSKLKKYLTFS